MTKGSVNRKRREKHDMLHAKHQVLPNKDTELGELVRDLTSVYPRPKSEARRRIKAYSNRKVVETLKMILQSAEDQEKASGRRWSRGTFILAMMELIDDLEQGIARYKEEDK